MARTGRPRLMRTELTRLGTAAGHVARLTLESAVWASWWGETPGRYFDLARRARALAEEAFALAEQLSAPQATAAGPKRDSGRRALGCKES